MDEETYTMIAHMIWPVLPQGGNVIVDEKADLERMNDAWFEEKRWG